MTVYQARSIERRHASWVKRANFCQWIASKFIRLGTYCIDKAQQVRNELA